MPDGNIVLMGGYDNLGIYKNDVWRSADSGATWTQLSVNPDWVARWGHSSIAMPDGSIVLMGGYNNSNVCMNDIWRFNPVGSSSQNPLHVYTTSGIYQVSLQAYNADGYNSTRKAGYITVYARPVPYFIGTPRSGTAPLTVTFTDSSTNSPTSWNWSFGDGATSESRNPVHTYTTPGTYTVCQKITYDGGASIKISPNYITVNAPPAPVANFTGTPTSGTAPLTVSFTDLSMNNPTGWTWYFGDEGYTEPWTQLTANAEWLARTGHSTVAMADGSIVLMGGFHGIYENDVWRSTDSGATWTQITANAGWSGRQDHSSVAMPDGSIVLMGGDEIGFANGYKNDVWRSTDGGATWMQVTPSAGWSARTGHSSVAMADGSIVLMGGLAGGGYTNDVWRSIDGGETWTQMTANAGWVARESHSSVVMPDGSLVLMGGNDGTMDYADDVWRSTDYGATWTRMTANAGWGRRSYHTSAVMPDGSIVLTGGYAGGGYKNDVWRSTDSGATWTQVTPNAGWPARLSHTSVVMPDGSIVLMGGFPFTNDVWRLMPTGSEAQNPIHTYSTPGTYQVTLQVYNSSGYDSTRKAGYITVSYGEYGSSSSEDTPFSITSTPTTPSSGKTITETVNVGGGSAVTRAEMTGSDLGKNLVITAFPRKSLPLGMVAPSTIVYQYISVVSSAIPGIVNRTTFDFSVPQSWLNEHGFTDGDIVMMHYENGQWQTLDTRCVSQDGGNVLYRATTPGFSYFAVAYEKGGTTMDNTGTDNPLTTAVPTTVAVLRAPVPDAVSPVPVTTEKTPAVPSAPIADRVGGIPLATIIIGTTGALVVIIGAVFVKRWQIRKQNPALFRKYD